MSDPWKADEPIREENFINESERSVDPTDDEYKVVKLESNGRYDGKFLNSPLASLTFETSDDFTLPNFGSMILFELWGAGGGGGAAKESRSFQAILATGGAGGNYAAILVPMFIFDWLGTGNTLSVVIGEGGDGKVVTAQGERVDGDNGGDTEISDYFRVKGGRGGRTTATSRFDFKRTSQESFESDIDIVNVLHERLGGFSTTHNAFSDIHNTSGSPGPSKYTGAGGGGGSILSGASPFRLESDGIFSEFFDAFGGNGAAAGSNQSATATDGGRACGGGGVAGHTNSNTITSGKGGNGYARITIY